MGFVTIFLFLFSAAAWSLDANSEKRLFHEDYRSKIKSYTSLVEVHRNSQDVTSATDMAVSYSQLDYKNAGISLTAEQALEAFDRGRDIKFITDSTHAQLMRRSTWLFPDDGCWARAALFSQNMQSWNFPRAFKVFAFGNLDVKTQNSPDGHVSWWYHVVPAAMVDHHVTIFDPAIEPRHPLPIEDWLLKMVPTLDEVKVSICSAKTFAPSSSCNNPDDAEETSALSVQTDFLDYEWDRLISLHRDPTKELEDNPPWSVFLER